MPLNSLQKISDHIILGIWEITETKEELALLLENDLIDVSKPINPAEKVGLHWFASRVLLQSLFSTHKLELHKDIHNKPTLFVDGEKYFISISHSHTYAGVMISSKHEVGMDIEIIDERIHRVAHKFLNTNEKEFAESTISKVLIWSAKEAVYKWYGKKELDFRENMEMLVFKADNAGVFNCLLHKNTYRKQLEVNYYLLNEYVITYCY